MLQRTKEIGIYCQDDQHFHRGQKIKYLMVKKDKGSIKKRLFCDECFLGQYNSLQQYCCNLEELINDRNYEAFKYTKFDSDYKQQYFNYARNHHPYLDTEFIQNMVSSLNEEIQSRIQDILEKFKEQVEEYLIDLRKWTENEKIKKYFDCDELRQALINEKFERSPQMFKELNEKAEKYVQKINNVDEKIDEKDIFKIDDIVSKQKQFFNLDRFNVGFNEIMQSIQKIEERTFSGYKFSTSTLATPYIETIVNNIAPKEEEKFFQNMKRIYRMTQQGSSYQALQQIDLISKADTITIIQTKNNCIFGVYNCISKPEKSILFQMNKKKIFQSKKNKKALQLNLQANLSNWILNFGEGDIVINSTFTKCISKLGTGFEISDTDILNSEEYLSNCSYFDVYDIEIFQTSQPNPIRKTPPFSLVTTIPPPQDSNQPPKVVKQGNLQGSIQGNMQGSIQGNMQGSIQGNLQGSIQGNMQGSIQGNMQGNLQGSIQGNMQGSFPGNMQGSIQGNTFLTTPFQPTQKPDFNPNQTLQSNPK